MSRINLSIAIVAAVLTTATVPTFASNGFTPSNNDSGGEYHAMPGGKTRAEVIAELEAANLVAGRFVDAAGNRATNYPENPNGSPEGITALTSQDGRVTIMMPHPERVFRTVQYSWHPQSWQDDAPWMRLFRNARVWVG